MQLMLPEVASCFDAETFLEAKLPNSGGSIDEWTDNWKLRCKADAMEDTRSCTILFQLTLYKNGDFLTIVREGGIVSFSVVGNKYPGSLQIIRVDSNESLRADADDFFFGNENLLAQIRAGKVIKTRWYDWPNNRKQDMEQTLIGFSKVLDLALKVVNGKEFSLPQETLENFYLDRAFSLAIARDSIRMALEDDYFATTCKLQFDADKRVEEILGGIPGATGGFHAG